MTEKLEISLEYPVWVSCYEDGKYIGGHWDLGGALCSGKFYQTLLEHPVMKGNPITGVWIDEAQYLDTPTKPKKQPKHKVPFWVKDWKNR